MQADAQNQGAAAQVPPLQAQLVIPATLLDVRQGLRTLMTSALVQDLTDDSLGTTELALAESLNNVVEHAYASHSGQIEVRVQRYTDELQVQIIDTGLPMPGAQPPYSDLPDMDAFADLPEGGFGWFLICSLVQNLTYHREGQQNTLAFAIAVDNRNA